MKKFFLILITVISLTNGFTFNVSASDFLQDTTDISTELISPRADVIVYKYKPIDGKLYKRRWNETKKVWVDSVWTPA